MTFIFKNCNYININLLNTYNEKTNLHGTDTKTHATTNQNNND
jgi:hypothetical protein